MVKQLLLHNIYAKKVVGTTNGKKAPCVLLPGNMGRILILRFFIGSSALWRNANERKELKTLEGGKSNENLVLGHVISHYKMFKPWTNVLCWTNCDIGVIKFELKLIWLIFSWSWKDGSTGGENAFREACHLFISALHPAENASPWPVGFPLPILTLSSHLHARVWDLFPTLSWWSMKRNRPFMGKILKVMSVS